MNSITLERSALQPGETLRGTVSWSIAHPPRDLEVRLFWYNGEPGQGEARTVERHKLGEAQEGRADFEFDLPELPWSVKGHVIKVGWAVELVEKKAGGLAVADFTMSPDGRVVSLGRVEKAITEKKSLLRP
jgi:hypothetical protein